MDGSTSHECVAHLFFDDPSDLHVERDHVDSLLSELDDLSQGADLEVLALLPGNDGVEREVFPDNLLGEVHIITQLVEVKILQCTVAHYWTCLCP